MAVVWALSDLANAHPSSSGNCANCHENSRDAFDIDGSDGTVDPVGGVGNLKYFDVLPNESVAVIANVFNGGGKYAPTVVEYSDGVWTEGSFTQGTGSSWTFDESGLDHYYVGQQSTNGSWMFDLAVAGGVAEGYYPFTFTVAGGNEDWADSEDFYVHVLASTMFDPGDVTMDGTLDGDDITAFVAGWQTVLPTDDYVTAWGKGDLNLDRVSDLRDAYLLHEALRNSGFGGFDFGLLAEAVPEPSSILLAAIMAGMSCLGGCFGRRRKAAR